MIKSRKSAAIGVVAACGLLVAPLAGVAHADTNVGSTTTFVAVGSDTTQDVMDGLSNTTTGVTVNDASGGAAVISNYLATPTGRTITTRTTAPSGSDCTFTVPRSSGEGTNALSSAMRGASFAGGGGTTTPDASANMTGCVDVARTSNGGNPTTSPGLGTITYVPFAVDAVTYAVNRSGSRPKAFNFTTLQSLYQRNGVAGSGACLGTTPLLPAFGSGTRSFWATKMGVTDYDFASGAAAPAAGVITWGSCVTGGAARAGQTGTAAGSGVFGDTKGGAPIQEHDGRVLTGLTDLIPFSVAQFLGQTGGAIPNDLRGNATLGSIDFESAGNVTAAAVAPMTLNSTGANNGFKGTNGDLTRDVYNAVPTSLINASFTPPAGATQVPISFSQLAVDTFVGANSKICKKPSVITRYGFGVNPNCGSTTKVNTNS